MGYLKRILAVLAVLMLVATACSDDPAPSAAEVDDALDEIEDPDPDPDPDPEPEPEPDPDPDPEPEPEPEPEQEQEAAFVITQACVLLRHYSNDLWEGFPYHGIILADTDVQVGTVETTHTHPSTGRGYDNGDGTFGIQVEWAIEAPGRTDFPAVMVDGVDASEWISDALAGLTGFEAAASDYTDEYIEPIPCPMGIFIPAGNTLGPPA